MEQMLLWKEEGKYYCEFVIDRSIVEKHNLKAGKEINIIDFFTKLQKEVCIKQ